MRQGLDEQVGTWRGGRGLPHRRFGGWKAREALEKQVGEAAPGPGSRDCLLPPPSPTPAPGRRTYPCDDLTGCGSTVGRWLGGCLSSESYKSQHRALPRGGWGCRAWPALGCPHARPAGAPREAGGRQKLLQVPTQQGCHWGRVQGFLQDPRASRSRSALPLRALLSWECSRRPLSPDRRWLLSSSQSSKTFPELGHGLWHPGPYREASV